MAPQMYGTPRQRPPSNLHQRCGRNRQRHHPGGSNDSVQSPPLHSMRTGQAEQDCEIRRIRNVQPHSRRNHHGRLPRPHNPTIGQRQHRLLLRPLRLLDICPHNAHEKLFFFFSRRRFLHYKKIMQTFKERQTPTLLRDQTRGVGSIKLLPRNKKQ